jgi:hypothetical protein
VQQIAKTADIPKKTEKKVPPVQQVAKVAPAQPKVIQTPKDPQNITY